MQNIKIDEHEKPLVIRTAYLVPVEFEARTAEHILQEVQTLAQLVHVPLSR